MRPWLAILLLLSCAAQADAAPDPAPLRIAFVRNNLAQLAKDDAGVYHGVSIDVAQAIAQRLGRPMQMLLLSPAAILQAVAGGEADLGFVAPAPDRMGVTLYSQVYMLVQQSALALDGSPLRSVQELDRAGNVVGANTGDSVAGYLGRTLQHATVKQSPDGTMEEARTWLRDGTVVAFAGNRQRLAAAIRGVPGLHLLPDNIYAVPQAVAVPLNDPALLATVEAVLNDLRASGDLERSVQRSGVDGLSVAPLP